MLVGRGVLGAVDGFERYGGFAVALLPAADVEPAESFGAQFHLPLIAERAAERLPGRTLHRRHLHPGADPVDLGFGACEVAAVPLDVGLRVDEQEFRKADDRNVELVFVAGARDAAVVGRVAEFPPEESARTLNAVRTVLALVAGHVGVGDGGARYVVVDGLVGRIGGELDAHRPRA